MAGKSFAAEYVQKVGGDIIKSRPFQAVEDQKHHLRSTVGTHSLRVAQLCAFFCDCLSKAGVETEKEDLVKAALCHDLGMRGRYTKRYSSGRDIIKNHPLNSSDEAEKLLGELTEMQREAIEKHMWPLCADRRIHHKETALITIADKLCAIADPLLAVKSNK